MFAPKTKKLRRKKWGEKGGCCRKTLNSIILNSNVRITFIDLLIKRRLNWQIRRFG